MLKNKSTCSTRVDLHKLFDKKKSNYSPRVSTTCRSESQQVRSVSQLKSTKASKNQGQIIKSGQWGQLAGQVQSSHLLMKKNGNSCNSQVKCKSSQLESWQKCCHSQARSQSSYNGITAYFKVRSGHFGSQVRSSQVRSGQIRSSQVRSGQVRSGQIRSTKRSHDNSWLVISATKNPVCLQSYSSTTQTSHEQLTVAWCFFFFLSCLGI